MGVSRSFGLIGHRRSLRQGRNRPARGAQRHSELDDGCDWNGWWRGLDSNQRRHTSPDLQSGGFNHSPTPPYRAALCAFFRRFVRSAAGRGRRIAGRRIGCNRRRAGIRTSVLAPSAPCMAAICRPSQYGYRDEPLSFVIDQWKTAERQELVAVRRGVTDRFVSPSRTTRRRRRRQTQRRRNAGLDLWQAFRRRSPFESSAAHKAHIGD